MYRTDDESDGKKSGAQKRERKKKEKTEFILRRRKEREYKREARGVVETRQRKYIKFNLNQLSFIDVARTSRIRAIKSSTPALDCISLRSSLTVALASRHSHRCCMPLSLCPRCLFTSQLLLFLSYSFARVRRLFRSDDRSSRQSISSDAPRVSGKSRT